MKPSIIDEYESALVYAEEPNRIKLDSFKIAFRGDYNNYVITYDQGVWHCNCLFFKSRGTCSHTMAIFRVFLFLDSLEPEISINTAGRGLDSAMIGAVEKGILYSEEPYRIKFDGFSLIFKGNNADHFVTYDQGVWHCDDSFFKDNNICAHVIATAEILFGSFRENKLNEESILSNFRAINLLEKRLRDLIDRRLVDAVGENYWKLTMPNDIIVTTKERIKLHISKNPYEDWHDYLPGRKRLDFCNISDYEKIILKNWTYFQEIFRDKERLSRHLSDFNLLRNAVMHNRSFDDVTRKLGEAAISWLHKTLDVYDKT